MRTRKHLDRHRTTSGVEYVQARNHKPGYMVLNRGSSTGCLRSLRRELRRDAPVRALPTGDPADALEVEWVLLLIRLIEELEDVSLDELDAYLGQSRRSLQTWVDAVRDVYEERAPYGTIGSDIPWTVQTSWITTDVEPRRRHPPGHRALSRRTCSPTPWRRRTSGSH